MQTKNPFKEQWQSFKKQLTPSYSSLLDFQSVQKEEDKNLIKRRQFQREKGRLKQFPADASEIRDDSVGLCLSGGGVRSATFNLGVLQALDKYEFLPRVDYLSTVSGGGYIGSSLVWFQSLDKEEHDFPFRRNEKDQPSTKHDHGKPSADAIIEWIHRHASYLTPGNGLSMWALFAAVARGTVINLLIAVPLLFAIIFYLSMPTSISAIFGLTPGDSVTSVDQMSNPSENLLSKHEDVIRNIVDSVLSLGWGFGIVQFLAILLFAWLFIRILSYALSSRISLSTDKTHDFSGRRKVSADSGRLLQWAVLLAAFGFLPNVEQWLTQLIKSINWSTQTVTGVSSMVGVISIIIGWATRRGKSETAGWRAILIKFGLTIVVYLLFLWIYYYASGTWSMMTTNHGHYTYVHKWILATVLVSLALGMMANINHVSMHRYYRNRLLECYLPDDPPPPAQPDRGQHWNAEVFKLSEIEPEKNGNPCLIINTNLTTLNSDVPRYRIRGGHNFTFTPWHVGSDASIPGRGEPKGWVKTKDFLGGRVDLGTALSISGAAVDPNTGATRSAPLAFIMAFLNVRLGYWIRNPVRPPLVLTSRNESPFFWHYYALREMLGWRMKETQKYVHLSDGGHFENLGLYELIRRKCRYIIVSDSGADPDFKFLDLACAVERVRVDFHADIDIGTGALKPDGDPKTSSQAMTAGTITYDDETTGKIIFLKSTVVEGLPKDIDGYQSNHKAFPHETTINQFFNDLQFEAYRELGFRLSSRIFEIGGKKNETLDEMFDINIPHVDVKT